MKFLRVAFIGIFSTCLLSAEVKDSASTQEANDFHIWESNNPNWYIGGGGFVNDTIDTRINGVETSRIGNLGSVETTTIHTHSPAWGYLAYAGYDLNKIVALEMKFSQSVVSNKYFLREIEVPDSPIQYNSQLNYHFKQIAFGPAALFSLPISQYFMPYVKAGMYAFYVKSTKDFDPMYTQPTTATMKTSYWVMKFIIGCGVRSNLTDWLGLRLDYECVTNPILSTTDKLVQGNLSLSAYFMF